MATLAPVSSFFIFQVLVWMVITEASEPTMHVTPTKISLGVTSLLDINCTFSLDNHPDMAAFISLGLSRANSSGQSFEELAVITEFSPDTVDVLTQEKVSATGVHSETGESFLQVTWQYPTATQAGVYKCSAQGVDRFGHIMDMVNISVVTVDEANINDIFEKLKEIENHETAMENRMSGMENHIQALKSNNSRMSSYITDLEHTVATLQRFKPMDLIGSYDNHDYYVSKEVFTDINMSIDVCKSYGGQLVEVDDEDEFMAIQGFLNHTTDHPYIMMAGTDEASKGNYVLPSTNKPVQYLNWGEGQPSDGASAHCLHFWYHGGTWKMADWYCTSDPPNFGIRYMCEIESL